MNETKTIQPEKKQDLVIFKVLEAQRELVFKHWTESELFKKWWGPKGFTAPFARLDPKVCGEFLHSMRSPEGKEFWSKGYFQELVVPEKIEMINSFADPAGNAVSASYYGLSEKFPWEMLVAVNFEEFEGDKTRLVLKLSRIENISPEDFKNMKQGWEESLDKLNEVVKKA